MEQNCCKKKGREQVKTNKILKVMCTIIIIILLVMISFIGIYVSKNGRMQNIVKDFTLGMELGGGRQIVLSPVDDLETVYVREDGKQLISADGIEEEELKKYTEKEVSINPEEVMNADNFKKAKEIFKKRLDIAGLAEYQISLDEATGNIVINAAEENVLDNIIYTLFASGKFVLQDTETLETLLDNNDIKDSQVGYTATQSGTGIYLTIQLNKEGTKKLEEISQTYIQTTDEEGNKTEKTVTLYIDGQKITTTYFGEKMTNGLLQLSIGTASTNSDQLTNYVTEATNLATILSTGSTTVEYSLTQNEYMESAISTNTAILLLLAAISIVTAMLVYTVVEYKDRGIIAAISFIGYLAALLLVVRLTNTVLTVESIGAIILSVIFNYVFLNILLSKLLKYRENDSTPKAEMSKVIKKALLAIVPALVIAVVFCFITYMAINSFGTTLFWGIAIFVIYNLIITRELLLNFEYLFEE